MSDKIVEWANELISDPQSVVLDTESCGGTKNDEIISLAIIGLADGEVLFNSLIKPSPDVKFNWYATQVHGITKSMLYRQPSLSDIWHEVYPLLHERNVLAFNHVADQRMIAQSYSKQQLSEPNINWHCIMRAYKAYRGVPSANLTQACLDMDVIPGTHDALDDTIAAARLVHRMARKYKLK